MQWYYAINGQRQGPVTEAEFESLVRGGAIRPDTLVWRQGMPSWQPFSQVSATLPPTLGAEPAAAAGEDDTAICAMSGKRYPKREMIQYEGKWISAEHRDAYFQRLREGLQPTGEFQYAGFWVRFLAKILDGLVMAIPHNLVNYALGVGFFAGSRAISPADPAFFAQFMLRMGLAMLVNTALGLLYYWYFLKRSGATPGKMALGLKVVRSDGSPLSTGRIIGRFFSEWVSAIVLYIGYIIAGFDDEKRALHDHICDTRVIKSR